MSKKVWIIVEPNFEYNDSTYDMIGEKAPEKAFSTKERAEQERDKKLDEYISGYVYASNLINDDEMIQLLSPENRWPDESTLSDLVQAALKTNGRIAMRLRKNAARDFRIQELTLE
jgi:hypothetical protein